MLTKGDKPDAEAIDGQQHLTTIPILLAAFCHNIACDQYTRMDLDIVQRRQHELGNKLTNYWNLKGPSLHVIRGA